MNKNLLILFCLFSLMQVSRAQDPIFGEPQHSTLSADSLSDVVGLIPESLDANVDSLLHSWHVQYFSKVDESALVAGGNPEDPLYAGLVWIELQF